MDLSIIIPVFNVEKYIRPCIESVYQQGLNDADFEVIIVNDGTKDHSMEVIADIIQQHSNIIVINQENLGLSMARNNGMAKATGEYIMFIDSDDLLIENSIPYLLHKAISSKADLVVADFMKMNDRQIVQFPITPFKQKDGKTLEKTGKELLLQDLNPHSCHVWRTLYSNHFLTQNNIKFIPNICYEDIPFTHQCYLKAKVCLRINWLFLIYRKGHSSITSSFNKKKGIDYCFAIAEIWKYSNEENLDHQIIKKLRDDSFVHYSVLVYSLTTNSKTSLSEKMYVINHLKKYAPNMSFQNGTKQKIVTFLYQKIPTTYIILRTVYAKYLQEFIWKSRKALNYRHKSLHYNRHSS